MALDLAEQHLAVTVPPEPASDFPGGQPADIEPMRSFGDVPTNSVAFLPAVALALKAKQFDDGLVAAVEAALEAGWVHEGGKPAFLGRVLRALQRETAGETATLVGASLWARGRPDLVPGDLEEPVRNILAGRAEHERVPLGMYTWGETLQRVYLGDKLLQRDLTAQDELPAVARALARDEDLGRAYSSLLSLAEGLTNRLAAGDLREMVADLQAGREPRTPSGRVALHPASRSVESDLIARLFGAKPVPDGFELSAEIVERIRSRRLRLEPKPDSGWYDWQLHALEAILLAPEMEEGTRVRFDDEYRREIEGLFKALYGLTRETHVKQLEIVLAGARAADLGRRTLLGVPMLLDLEPLVTYYERRAASYRFVRGVLEAALGEAFLEDVARITSDGPVNMPLAMELSLLEDLFQGAAHRARRLLGLPVAEPRWSQEAVLQAWRMNLDEDPDLGRDIRMMVPVFYDMMRGKYRVWAVLGLGSRPIEVAYQRPPRVASISRDGRAVDRDSFWIVFERIRVDLPYLISAELWTDRLLDRPTFQALCDEARTVAGVLSRFEE